MHLVCPHCRNPIELVEPCPPGEILCPSCGSSFRMEHGSTTGWQPPSGRRLGRFELLEAVGLGAFGTVYKARDPQLDRTVAVKVPRAGNLAGAAELDRFVREARSVAQLRHPSIVTVHEVGQADGLPYLVSDFVEGVTLSDLLTARRPSFRESAELAASVADALEYAHSQGVVHRDVKPSNIMLESPNQQTQITQMNAESNLRQSAESAFPSLVPRLMDFGLAKRDAGEITMTMDGQVLGTPAYMSPEQALGESHQVDGRSDVYSLGVILFQLLTGELPFRGNVRMLLHQVRHDEPRPPRSLNDRVPRDLETVCLKAMAKEPGRRYATAGELADDLRRWLKGEPIAARPVGRSEKAWRWCKRNPVVAGLAAAVFVTLAAGMAVSAYFAVVAQLRAADATNSAVAAQAEEERANAKAAEAEANAAESRQLLGHFCVSKGDQLAREGDLFGALAWFAEPLVRDPGNQAQEALTRLRLAAYRRQCPRLVQFWLHDGRVKFVTFSPDGRRALAICGKEVWLWDTVTGQAVGPPLRHDDELDSAAFSPDGRWVTTLSAPPARGIPTWTALVWDAATARQVPLPTDGLVNFVRFSPDGRKLVTTQEKMARVWDWTTRKPIGEPVMFQEPVTQAAFSPDGRSLAVLGAKFLYLWNLGSDNLARPTVFKMGKFKSAEFSPNGQQLLTIGIPWHKQYAWQTRLLLGVFGAQAVAAAGVPTSLITQIIIPPKLVGVGLRPDDERDEAQAWDMASGRPAGPSLTNPFLIMDAVFSPDGRQVVTAGGDGDARVWEVGSNDPPMAATPPLSHSAGVIYVGFSPDGSRVFTTCYSEKQARVWNVASGKPAFPPFTHQSFLYHAAFSPDGRYFLTCGVEGAVCMWDLAPERRVRISGLGQSKFSPDGRRLVSMVNRRSSGGNKPEKELQFWDAVTLELVRSVLLEDVDVSSMDFTQDSSLLITVNRRSTSDEREVHVWDTATGQLVGQPWKFLGQVSHAAPDHDGRCCVMTLTSRWVEKDRYEAEAQFRDAVTGRPGGPAFQFQETSPADAFPEWDPLSRSNVKRPNSVPHERRVGPMTLCPKSGAAVVCTRSAPRQPHRLYLWDGRTGRLIGQPISLPRFAGKMAFSPDGTTVLAAAGDARGFNEGTEIQTWDAATGRPAGPTLRILSSVMDMAFSPDGRWVVVADMREGAARVWEWRTGQPIGPPVVFDGVIHHVAFSPDGQLLLTVGSNNNRGMPSEVQVWDPRTGQPVTPPLRQGSRTNAMFSPDGRRILTGDGQVWSLAPDDRPAADLVLLTQLLNGGRRLDKTGGYAPLSAQELRAAWETLRSKYPQEFSP